MNYEDIAAQYFHVPKWDYGRFNQFCIENDIPENHRKWLWNKKLHDYELWGNVTQRKKAKKIMGSTRTSFYVGSNLGYNYIASNVGHNYGTVRGDITSAESPPPIPSFREFDELSDQSPSDLPPTVQLSDSESTQSQQQAPKVSTQEPEVSTQAPKVPTQALGVSPQASQWRPPPQSSGVSYQDFPERSEESPASQETRVSRLSSSSAQTNGYTELERELQEERQRNHSLEQRLAQLEEMMKERSSSDTLRSESKREFDGSTIQERNKRPRIDDEWFSPISSALENNIDNLTSRALRGQCSEARIRQYRSAIAKCRVQIRMFEEIIKLETELNGR